MAPVLRSATRQSLQSRKPEETKPVESQPSPSHHAAASEPKSTKENDANDEALRPIEDNPNSRGPEGIGHVSGVSSSVFDSCRPFMLFSPDQETQFTSIWVRFTLYTRKTPRLEKRLGL